MSAVSRISEKYSYCLYTEDRVLVFVKRFPFKKVI